VKKTVDDVVTVFYYDINNNLISETDGDGNPQRDYIYLGSQPVAMIVYGAQGGTYYFINDHLGTPQQLVDDSWTVVWQAAYLPYGEAQVLIETVVNNLRFPGQYYDEETGLHYNWNRYYDPGTGRYITPDPIGLAGGLNLFAYVGGDPVNWIDPMGLHETVINPFPHDHSEEPSKVDSERYAETRTPTDKSKEPHTTYFPKFKTLGQGQKDLVDYHESLHPTIDWNDDREECCILQKEYDRGAKDYNGISSDESSRKGSMAAWLGDNALQRRQLNCGE
jgi:RHS repeat-associated protein